MAKRRRPEPKPLEHGTSTVRATKRGPRRMTLVEHKEVNSPMTVRWQPAGTHEALCGVEAGTRKPAPAFRGIGVWLWGVASRGFGNVLVGAYASPTQFVRSALES